jgi:hypothetical protein
MFPERPGGIPAPLTSVPGPAGPMALPSRGLLRPGNIDLSRRKIVRNKDGSISTIRAFYIQDDQGRTVLLPSMDKDGNVMTMPAAVRYWSARGQSLGIFDTPANAEAYESTMHDLLSEQYRRMGVFDRPAGPRGRPATTSAASTRRVWSEPGSRDVVPSQIGPQDVGRSAAGARSAAAAAPTDLFAETPPGPSRLQLGGEAAFRWARGQIPAPIGTAPVPRPGPEWNRPPGPSRLQQTAESVINWAGRQPVAGARTEEPLPLNVLSPGNWRHAQMVRTIMPRWRHLTPPQRHQVALQLGAVLTGWLDRNAP